MLVKAVLGAPGGEELLPLLTTRGQPLLSAARERFSGFIREGWPDTDPADAELVADVAVRHTLSHVLTGIGDPAWTARQLRRALGPFLDAYLDGSAARDA